MLFVVQHPEEADFKASDDCSTTALSIVTAGITLPAVLFSECITTFVP